MQNYGALDFLPLWGLFGCTLALVLLCVECGYRLGRYRHHVSAEEKPAPVSGMVEATLGLLAFLLAFTFGLAATKFDSRRQLQLDEVNAIGTAYLRAELLPEGHDEIRGLLRQYVDANLDAMSPGKLEQSLRRCEELHGQLWARTTVIAEKNSGSVIVGLFVQALNDVIDLHAKRVALGLRSRIPGAIWAGLYSVAALALVVMGYHAGLEETRRSLAVVAVAFAFSVVIWLIADLDRPQEGLLQVSQQGMVELRNSIAEPKH